MEMTYKTIEEKEFKKLVTKLKVPAMYGSDTIEYHVENCNAYIVKSGNKIQLDRNLPYQLVYKRDYKRFKTLKEAMAELREIYCEENGALAI